MNAYRKVSKEVFVVSKPIAPPWNDSGKNIARELVAHGQRYGYRILTTNDFAFHGPSPKIRYERIYPSGGTFQAGIRQNLKVMFTGLRKKNAAIYHYFFAPNRTSATAGRIQSAVARVKTIQTFSSRPASYENISKLIFTDKVITLSKHTRQKLLRAGVSGERVVHVPPGITPPEPLTPDEVMRLNHKYRVQEKRIVLFPGDFEFSSAARQVAEAAPPILESNPNVVLIFACRAKTDRSRAASQKIAAQLSPYGDRVRFINEIDDMPRFVGLAEIILLPQDDLYAKMDIPLVLLEAMSHKVPLVVADAGPLQELVTDNAALGTRDANDVAKETIRLLGSSDERTHIGEAGRALIDTRYNALQMAKSIENLYDELLSR